ncbi:hypothetical protein FHX03_002394 [Rhizobium sp. BK456]|nr:hypothetical protein [Rhizobium sp. BK456]
MRLLEEVLTVKFYRITALAQVEYISKWIISLVLKLCRSGVICTEGALGAAVAKRITTHVTTVHLRFIERRPQWSPSVIDLTAQAEEGD